MNSSGIILLTFASVMLLVICVGVLAYDWIFRYRFALQDRLKELSDLSGDQSVVLFKDIRKFRGQAEQEKQSWLEWLQQFIDKSGAACTPLELGMWCTSSGLVLGVVCLYLSWWLAPAAIVIGAAVPLALLYFRQHLRKRMLSRQLPEVFQMISRAVRAGQTVPAALKIIADDFQPPVSEEFALCYQQQNLGISRESALYKLAERSGIMELQIFVVALLVQAKSGGDLVELLDNLAAMIQKRLKLKDRVRALTGEGRMQAVVLLVLPVMALVGLVVFSPDYAESLLDRPMLLGTTVVAQLAGALWIRSIVNFEY